MSSMPDVVKATILERIAVLSLSGTPKTQIGKELGLSPRQVTTLMEQDEFQAVVQNLGESLSNEAKNKLRKGLARLVDKSLKVLETSLDEGELEAVKVVFRGLGFDRPDDTHAGTSITVNLPTTTEEIIEVKQEE